MLSIYQHQVLVGFCVSCKKPRLRTSEVFIEAWSGNPQWLTRAKPQSIYRQEKRIL